MIAVGPEVMLASPGYRMTREEVFQKLEGWFWEIKLDGIRAVVDKSDDGVVRIYNRRRTDISHRYPEVVAECAAADFVGAVDGEIVVADKSGRPDFALAHLRDAQSRTPAITALAASTPALFMPFDVLSSAGVDLRAEPYTVRHDRLLGMFPAGRASLSSTQGRLMWQFVLENHLEGLVAKCPGSTYRAGRQPTWVKLKATYRISALVCGTTPGKTSRKIIGSLKLALWDPEPGELVSIGSVGSGMSDRDLSMIKARLEAGSPLVVDVEYLEISPNGRLRNPVFRGINVDSDPAGCTIDSLEWPTAQHAGDSA